MNRPRQPFHAKDVGEPVSFTSGVVSCRTAGSPGVLPCCFPCVTVRSTKRDISITGGLILVLHSRPCSLAYTCRRAVSSLPSALFDRPACSLPASFNPPFGRISAFRYTSALSTCGWTCSLIVPPSIPTLDAGFEFGTLAERTSKQPGTPGTQQDTWSIFLTARTLSENAQVRRWPEEEIG